MKKYKNCGWVYQEQRMGTCGVSDRVLWCTQETFKYIFLSTHLPPLVHEPYNKKIKIVNLQVANTWGFILWRLFSLFKKKLAYFKNTFKKSSHLVTDDAKNIKS